MCTFKFLPVNIVREFIKIIQVFLLYVFVNIFEYIFNIIKIPKNTIFNCLNNIIILIINTFHWVNKKRMLFWVKSQILRII